MIRTWINGIRKRNYFDSSTAEEVREEDLKRILRGKVINPKKSSEVDHSYFIVCENGIEEFENIRGRIEFGEIENIADLLDKSEWFGKFKVEGQSQMIIPGQYNFLIKPKEKKLYLTPNTNARYYGNGNLQYDKDIFTRIIPTKIGYSQLKEIVHENCNDFEHKETIDTWF